MEDIIRTVFTEDDEFDVKPNTYTYTNNPNNSKQFIINSLSSFKYCLMLEFFVDHIVIQNLNKCDNNSGTNLLLKIDELVKKISEVKKIPEIKYIELFDGSTISLNNIEIDLAFFKILTTGQSWYNCFGYVSNSYQNEVNENKELRNELLTLELIDSCKETLIIEYYKKQQIYFADITVDEIKNKTKEQIEEQIEDKITNLKKKLVDQFPVININKPIKIKDFFNYINENKSILNTDQITTLKDLIQIIGVLIKYNRKLKKIIEQTSNNNNNNNNNNSCTIMGGKIKKHNTQKKTKKYKKHSKSKKRSKTKTQNKKPRKN